MESAFASHELRVADVAALEAALTATCIKSHVLDLMPLEIILAMRGTWEKVRRPDTVSIDEWTRTYNAALGLCLATYFGQHR
jgi:hypothetical protein